MPLVFFGKFGKVLPKLETIEIGSLNVHERPDFRFRNIWYSGWMPGQGSAGVDFGVWLDHNRMNSLNPSSLSGLGRKAF